MKKEIREIYSVNRILNLPEIIILKEKYNNFLINYFIKKNLNKYREKFLKTNEKFNIEFFVENLKKEIEIFLAPNLKEVVNATGIIIHTNLGRSPLGNKVLKDMKNIILGYSNLEYDLKIAKRGKRDSHVSELLKYITGAEDIAVVNNNAAALILVLNTLSNTKEVIISRGELVEIGGSFRIPEILKASGAKMVEVGTTNKTHRKDYINAINSNTALILKVHKSNYTIQGFSEEVSIKELVELSKTNNIPLVYDIGSGLLIKYKGLNLLDEPTVKEAMDSNVDIITFSADKLLGGPQAGIIAGEKHYIKQLKKAPMKRALRVGKLTLSALESVLRNIIIDDFTPKSLPLYKMLNQKKDILFTKAEKLKKILDTNNIESEIRETKGRCGGGTLPNHTIDSYSVVLNSNFKNQKKRKEFAENIYYKLSHLEKPVISSLRQGEIFFDVLTITSSDLKFVAENIILSIEKMK